MTNNKHLFLDDRRFPSDAYSDSRDIIYLDFEWELVESYNEFVKWIETNGIPKVISFDHDLAESHYTPSIYWNDYAKSKEWQDAKIHDEKTGYDCALWLLEYCTKNSLELPIWFVHSLNPVGADKIKNLLLCSKI